GRLVEDDELALARLDVERRGARDFFDEVAIVAGGVDNDGGLDRPVARGEAPSRHRALTARDGAAAPHLAALGDSPEHIGERRRPGIYDMFAGDDDGGERARPEMGLAAPKLRRVDGVYVSEAVALGVHEDRRQPRRLRLAPGHQQTAGLQQRQVKTAV